MPCMLKDGVEPGDGFGGAYTPLGGEDYGKEYTVSETIVVFSVFDSGAIREHAFGVDVAVATM